MTLEERKATIGQQSFKETHSNKREERLIDNIGLPPSWDWRLKGAVTPVKDQGQCTGSLFGIVGSVEGCHQITTGKLVVLNEQQVATCDTTSCNGKFVVPVWEWILKNPLNVRNCFHSCAFDPQCCGSNVSAVVDVSQGSEDALQVAVYSGPVAALIDASHESFLFYSSGVYYEPACSSTALNHGVLITGWGTDANGKDFWIVKNSWGPDWGESGYVYMARNRNNNCGIATNAQVPRKCYSCGKN